MKKTKLTKLVLTVLISFSLFNCEKDAEDTFEASQNEAAKSAHVCIEKWNFDKDSRAASVKAVQWQPGQTIRVKFLNGNNFVQSKVRQYAVEWESYANLKFEFVSSNSSANIKIGFKEGQFADDGGSWSYLGTDSNNHAHSMHFGWFNNNTSDAEFRRTTLHEFGHALGLIHEHQNPVAGINWNKEVVYAYYAGAPNFWSRAQVDNNLFRRYDQNITNYSVYDSRSIMHYPIPAAHTTDGVAVGNNSQLSATDKSFIASIYPGGNTGGGDICSGVAEYNSSTSYSVGDKVTYQGNLYERTASGWTNLGQCGSTANNDICSGVAAYNSGASYSVGDKVTYQGSLYERTASGWTNLGQCGS
ncbi:carbohydrate-binding protein [Aquimarina sp. 2201CG5-10]|uniref:carbohydrate-binding protein n=1 Tax=Aquimarina callyspongiae TaxID=3098150 RepID=UPI002AB345EE|nr:carbohydrate-binding protein [Aquimarina sp. 2201CG5-10]MDY8135117.1 M12 family metallopeptidase [Aquimarina sp. 2201CG5-10]